MQRHYLVKTNKTAYLCIELKDGKKVRKIQLIRVHGWKAELAYKFFNFKANGWNEDVAKAFIGLNALRIAEDEWEARRYINVIKEMKKLDIHFWVGKFLSDRKKADKAWRAMYEE